jgi:hypothetical protein
VDALDTVAQRDGIVIRDRGEEGVLDVRKACQRLAGDPLHRVQPAFVGDGGAVIDDIGCGDTVNDREIRPVHPLLENAPNDGQVLFWRRGPTIGHGRGTLRRGDRRRRCRAPQEQGECNQQLYGAFPVAMHARLSSRDRLPLLTPSPHKSPIRTSRIAAPAHRRSRA